MSIFQVKLEGKIYKLFGYFYLLRYNTPMERVNNIKIIKDIDARLKKLLPIKLGVNKRNELLRLIYEIALRDGLSPDEVLQKAHIAEKIEEGKSSLFHRIKESLLEVRFPSMKKKDDPHLVPLKISEPFRECSSWDFTLSPKKVFVEKEARRYEWTSEFLAKFPNSEVIEVGDVKEALRGFSAKEASIIYSERRKNVFIVKSKDAFIKICPCTKKAKRCGYWILNIGFGCPIDCSYCYLQLYSNAPAMVFPANIEEYYDYIKKFDRKVTGRTRIGTGEFTDSLAFDKYTGYSLSLIPFFRDMKNLVLELKTKVADIDNVLKEEPNSNVVISWSINTPRMASRYEKGASSVEERIEAARSACERGYKVGFHFDPVVYYDGWEEEYKDIVDALFKYDIIRKNTSWISLGTLRYTPGLKQAAEERFTDNLLFYKGEFFTGFDGKLRYPRELRVKMYKKVAEQVAAHDTRAWIYLCMEPEEVWKEALLKEKHYIF